MASDRQDITLEKTSGSLISSMAVRSGHAGVSHWQCTLLVAVCLILPRELCFMYNVQ